MIDVDALTLQDLHCIYLLGALLLMKIFSMLVEASAYRIAVGRARHRELMTRSHRNPVFPRSWYESFTLKFAMLHSLWCREIATVAP